MASHIDVNIPSGMHVGFMLEKVKELAMVKGLTFKTVEKPPGNHVTPWWLYVTFCDARSKQSTVQIGETVYAKVNKTPHLWVRGKAGWIELGRDLLLETIGAQEEQPSQPPKPSPEPVKEHLLPPKSTSPQTPRRPPMHRLRAAFNGTLYGPGYLVADADALILPLSSKDDQGWVFGILNSSGERGWYPLEWVHVV